MTVHVYGEPEERDFLYPEEALCTDRERVAEGPEARARDDYTWYCPNCGQDSAPAAGRPRVLV